MIVCCAEISRSSFWHTPLTDPTPQHVFKRRFGLAGGLIWLGILTFGVVSEQIKTRLEEGAERRDTKVPSSLLPYAMDSQVVKAHPISSSCWWLVLCKHSACSFHP